MASTSRMFARKRFPRPSPLLAPLTRPAMSTKVTVAGVIFSEPNIPARTSSRGSGMGTTPTLGSIVANGSLAATAPAAVSALNSVDLPTLGRPTIPMARVMRGATLGVGGSHAATVRAHGEGGGDRCRLVGDDGCPPGLEEDGHVAVGPPTRAGPGDPLDPTQRGLSPRDRPPRPGRADRGHGRGRRRCGGDPVGRPVPRVSSHILPVRGSDTGGHPADLPHQGH